MKKNTLKKLMVISIGTMALLGSSISVSAAVWHPCVDKNKDHKCDEMIGDTPCPTIIGKCEDLNKDHYCDYGCGKYYGRHEDADIDHRCDYECKEPIGAHEDTNDDHLCDYGCGGLVTECSGGTATCTKQAICKTCGKSYGDLNPNNHVDENGSAHITVSGKEPTCTEAGHELNYYCNLCNTQYITGAILPALNHIDSNNDHYCDRFIEDRMDPEIGDCISIYCNTKISDCKGGTATCKDRAICEICNNPYGDVDKSNHVGDTEIRDAKPAKCTEDGYTGDTYCKSCNTKLMDGEPIAKLGHIDENKDHECDREDCKAKLSDHTGGTATCKDVAICEYCNNPYGEVDKSNHVGDTEIRDAKPATCTEDGYTGDTYCKDCNTKLQDGIVIPATGHIDTDNNNECDSCKSVIKETEKPVKKETEASQEPKTVETASNLSEAPKTGDSTPIITLFSLLSASIVVIFACVTCRSRKED